MTTMHGQPPVALRASGRWSRSLLMAALCAALAACSSPAPRTGSAASGATRPDAAARPGPARSGGYYLDDGPGDNPPADLMAIPDAVPRPEPLLARANRPYVVFDRQYQPMSDLVPFRQRGLGSWYGRKYHGRRTSSGEVYDMYAMTAAHPTLPIPSYARVTHLPSGRSVVVRVNDRGPFLHDRVIDLSYTAATRLGYASAGSAPVEVELITSFDASVTGAARGVGPSPVMLAAAGWQTAQVSASTAGAGAPRAESATVRPASEPPMPERLDMETVASPGQVSPSTAPAGVPPDRRPPAAVPPGTSVPPSAAPDARPESGVFLQLGAFSSRDNAEAARERLEPQLDGGAPLRVRPDGGRFRLLMGPYASRADALAAADRVAQRSGSRPFVVVR